MIFPDGLRASVGPAAFLGLLYYKKRERLWKGFAAFIYWQYKMADDYFSGQTMGWGGVFFTKTTAATIQF